MHFLQKIMLCAVLFIWTVISPAQNNFVYPLKISPGNRYLVDQNDRPFLWVGDTAWSLFVQVSTADAIHYLENRQQKGFNIILVNLIEHKFCTHAPANYYQQPPFTGRPFSSPNEAYFSHADSIIQAAADLGIVVLLCPLYLGYNCGDEGFCADVKSVTAAELFVWGQYIGERYSRYDNIIWCIGGDTDPGPVRDKVIECVKGVLDKDKKHLFTAHNNPESQAVIPWKDESWLAVNDVYTYNTALYQQCKAAYDRAPLLPFFMIESAYENEHQASQVRLRSEAYWPMLCGAMGQIFGNCPIWHFGASPNWCSQSDWKAQLDAQGSLNMSHLKQLFSSRPWHLLVPDFDHAVMTDGFGTWGKDNYAAAACAADSSTLIAYLPSAYPVTIDMRKLSGEKSSSRWFNPRTGEYTENRIFANTGSLVFTPPTNEDWVLVIDGDAIESPVKYGFSNPDEQNNAPAEFGLWQNHPNPCNPGTEIGFAVAKPEHVRITIYDIVGRPVRVSMDESKRPGAYSVIWDGVDRQGNLAPAGLYLVHMEAGEFKATKKLLVVK
jgi:hypothetical protein